MLVKVQSCSLSPGDLRLLSGEKSDILKTLGVTVDLPYIPGGDISGIVEEVEENKEGFKVGDYVIATWDSSKVGLGGLAEYTTVPTKLAALKPAGISWLEGAALANSNMLAMQAVEAAGVKQGDRVLVIGGSGGMGCSIVQMAKHAGAEFLAATSTDETLLKGLGVDLVVDYTKQPWWENEELAKAPFDVIIDCAEGTAAWRRAKGSRALLKSGWQGGRFLAVVLHEWDINIKSMAGMMAWFMPIVARQFGSRVMSFRAPRYKMFMLDSNRESLEASLKMVESGQVKTVMDPACPYPFTTDGVRAAFTKLEERKGHGKLVIQVGGEEAKEG
ncbi:unnamed protein product [Chrysoparadoxa australica]